MEWSQEVVIAQDAGGGQNPALDVKLISGSTTVTVGGKVVDLATQQPIPGATVVIGDAKTTTAADGSFVFENVRVGSVVLRVTAEGYDPYEATLNIAPGMGTLRIELAEASPTPPPPPHNVTGTVTIRNRPDNSGAVVSAYNLRVGLVMDTYSTGRDGVYYLFVPPGDYELRVEYAGRLLTRQLTVPGGGRILTGIDFVVTAPPQ
ncbi:MAG: carboxypeptidase regulatory-like domain-containing protein [Armatimonadetes bacterium]|nr:carboxypeptidase regulatory-like domain-containing protein [Armatimonadota bacterium]